MLDRAANEAMRLLTMELLNEAVGRILSTAVNDNGNGRKGAGRDLRDIAEWTHSLLLKHSPFLGQSNDQSALEARDGGA